MPHSKEMGTSIISAWKYEGFMYVKLQEWVIPYTHLYFVIESEYLDTGLRKTGKTAGLDRN